MKLDKLSLEELKSLARDVEKAIAGYEEKQRKEALKAMEAVAKQYGMSVQDVVGGKAKAGKKAKAAPKYRNPNDASQTWSGRGRQPAWYKEAISSGKSPKQLAI